MATSTVVGTTRAGGSSWLGFRDGERDGEREGLLRVAFVGSTLEPMAWSRARVGGDLRSG